ncbi:MAG TPA: PepSY domain-containing protein [Candidatus Copromorpha excrementigallinarum]|uniref:PepSY domain-containing protein n=1 Tax=Candidatus Allocopromorpha excrementigallinarum TaxID=2840742 RepID=A0A9D1I192_9FIRM|nr:PepSY domain-containing protein [Candidatus Copromorpha excrementigallinarum]
MTEKEKKSTEETMQEKETDLKAEEAKAEGAGEGKKPSKKKKVGIIAAAVVVVLVIIGLIAANAMGVIGGISEAEARQIAVSQVPGATEENVIEPVLKELDDGRSQYEVRVVYDGMSYEFVIAAKDGAVVGQDAENVGGGQQTAPAAGQQTAPATDIGLERAREIALGQAPGATADNIVSSYANYDDGRYVYDVEIIYNEMKYDVEIDAATGDILQMDRESVYD